MQVIDFKVTSISFSLVVHFNVSLSLLRLFFSLFSLSPVCVWIATDETFFFFFSFRRSLVLGKRLAGKTVSFLELLRRVRASFEMFGC